MPPENIPPEENPAAEAHIQATLQGNQTLDSIDKNTEAGALASAQTTDAIKGLETPLDTIALNTQPKDVQKISIVPSDDPDDPAWNENQAGADLWKMLRGPKGHTPVKGVEYYTPEEKKELISEIVPLATPVYKKDYLTPEEQDKIAGDILDQAKPVKGIDYSDGEPGPPGYTPQKGLDYEDGKDAPPVDVDALFERLVEMIPEAVPGKDGSPDTAADIIKKIRGKMSWRDLKDRPDIPNKPGGGGGQDITVLDENTVLTAVLKRLQFTGPGIVATQTADGSVMVNVSGSGMVNVVSLQATATQSGANVHIDLSQYGTTSIVPIQLSKGGGILTPFTEWSVSSGIVTVPNSDAGSDYVLLFSYTGTVTTDPVPPPGYIFLIDSNGDYLTDADGAYLIEPI